MVTSGLQTSPSVSRECKEVGTDVQKNQGPKALTTGEHGIWGGRGSRGRVRHGPGNINNHCEHPGKAKEAGKPCLITWHGYFFPERVNPTVHPSLARQTVQTLHLLAAGGTKGEGVPCTRALPPHCVTFKKASILLNGLKLLAPSSIHDW